MAFGVYVALNIAVLAVAARMSSLRGLRLFLALFLLGFVVGLANNLIEAVAFGVMPLKVGFTTAALAAPMFAIMALVAVTLSWRWRGTPQPSDSSSPFTVARLVTAILAYEILYWTAGTLVYPYIAAFYATRHIPPVALVASLQIVRALIFVGAAYPLIRSGLRFAPLVLALAYSIIGGAAPLLLDNPYMPVDIRFYHGIEVTSSNFLFGIVLGLLFGRRRLAERAQA